MKLNYGRSMLVGLAFLTICAFWQLYDFVIPLILRDTFLIGDAASGWIMALDNILALFMLPLFGRLSDRTHTKLGRRMPYIVCGTLGAALLMGAMPSAVRSASNLLESVYTGAKDYSAWTQARPGLLALFIAMLVLLLISMGVYRSPAVALMPDVTPKPLRSKANAIINLMGAVGGIITLALVSLLVKSRTVSVLGEYSATGEMVFSDCSLLFYLTAAVMVASIAALVFTIKENKLRINDEDEETALSGGKLPAPMRKSLILILVSVFFWYMGYNAVTTAYSKYFVKVWGDVSGAAFCLTVAMAGAIVSYLPIGILSSKVGRKRMVLLGITLLAACFGISTLIKSFNPGVYALFVMLGIGWAAISVNSYPMVMEISRAGDVGKYTGYYYTFSMAGQIITPIISGFLLEHVGYSTLFPYALGMVAVSFITMLFVRHGDSRPEKAASVLENFNTED